MTQFPVGFRCLGREDFPLLAKWLASPHVERWWQDPSSLEAVREAYEPCVTGDDPTKVFIIEYTGRPVGMIQCYRMADNADWDELIGIPAAAGIDYLIGEADAVGLGLGSRAIELFVDEVLDLYREIESIVVTTDVDNEPSWRALERAGFTRIDKRQIDSGHPCDIGMSYVYARYRTLGDSSY